MTFITFGPARGPDSLLSLSSAELAASVAGAASALTSTGSATPATCLSSNAGLASATCALASISVLQAVTEGSALGLDTGAADLLALLLPTAPFCSAALPCCFAEDAASFGDGTESLVPAALALLPCTTTPFDLELSPASAVPSSPSPPAGAAAAHTTAAPSRHGPRRAQCNRSSTPP
uniref:Starch synthase IIb-2 n=1 Tax=Arundo donax TaxID=35708 RepID=A0A0A9FIU6_ARUDO